MSIKSLWKKGDPLPKCGLDCSNDKVIVKQEFKEKQNINNIMAKARAGQQIDPSVLSFGVMPQYADVSYVPTLQEAHEIIQQAKDDFNMLPSEVRERFNHDPMKLVNFVLDSKNRPEAEKLGLVKPTPVKPPAESEPTKSGEGGAAEQP